MIAIEIDTVRRAPLIQLAPVGIHLRDYQNIHVLKHVLRFPRCEFGEQHRQCFLARVLVTMLLAEQKDAQFAWILTKRLRQRHLNDRKRSTRSAFGERLDPDKRGGPNILEKSLEGIIRSDSRKAAALDGRDKTILSIYNRNENKNEENRTHEKGPMRDLGIQRVSHNNLLQQENRIRKAKSTVKGGIDLCERTLFWLEYQPSAISYWPLALSEKPRSANR